MHGAKVKNDNEHLIWRISWQTETLVASQEGLGWSVS